MQTEYREGARLLTRREALAVIAAGGVGLFAGAVCTRVRAADALPQCIARPQQMEGPFFVDERLNRADIRSDPATGATRAGVPLRVSFRVATIAERCTPIAGAQVDLWHCDAAGAYSDVRDASGSTNGQKFLRGYQMTGADGTASFTTIYPGWYRGRAVHLHFKVRTGAAAARRYEFTSQVYFDDELSDRIFSRVPYAGRGARDVRNAQDGLFARGGKQLLLPLKQDGQGYSGVFDLGLSIG
jgi:protocatechuate 3,4-dioxygenase beta subunit